MILFGPAVAPLAANMAKTISWRKIEATTTVASIEKAVTMDPDRNSRREQSRQGDDNSADTGPDTQGLISYSAEGEKQDSGPSSGLLNVIA